MTERPNLNTGEPWSETDDRDLRAELQAGQSIEEAARFLCRTIDEVEKRMRELGLSVAS